jgi:chemotaxis methyl-accepting protein methylase
MTDPLSDIAALIRSETGILIRGPQLSSLERSIDEIVPGTGPAGFLEQVEDPELGPGLLSRLVDQVTIQETYFYREARELRSIDWAMLRREAAADGENVRVWVPACATGEEAYTLALLAMEAFGSSEPPVSILATDVASTAIELALAGRYSARSVRNIPDALRERHFERDGNEHVVRDPLKSAVSFARHNLVTEAFPPMGEAPFHLIVCRNVLIYFGNDTVQRVVASLTSALAPDGELVLGAADRLTGTTARLAGAPVTPSLNRARRETERANELRRPLGLPQSEAGVQVDLAPPIPSGGPDNRIEIAMRAADAGDLGQSLEVTSDILNGDPLNADAFFVRGVAELAGEDADAAIASLRSCLYIDPSFALAAFELGRAYDSAGDRVAAQRAYRRALGGLAVAADRHHAIIDQVERDDVAAACRLRLDAAEAATA